MISCKFLLQRLVDGLVEERDLRLIVFLEAEVAVSPNSFWIAEMARSRFFLRASAIFSAALSLAGEEEEAGEAAALGAGIWSSEEAEEAFWLAIGLGLAATVLMTISI